MADAEREAVLACMRERYRDFGPTLAAEYLKFFHGFTRWAETLCQWMIGEQLWVDRRAWHPRGQASRERLRLQDDVGGAVAIRAFALQHHLPLGVAAQAFVGQRGAGDVTA
ncbi:MAG: hypothetical protein LW876_10985 [Betaproteobacteria bacterium]|jgi:hypothetical protein|nr:hypothetical protein [Rhodocyclaceae bacterium]MCE2898473.1 hypothetical protein [Betaproteobacteria bacterium]